MKKILKCFNFIWPKSSRQFFQIANSRFSFFSIKFWKCSARKICALEKAEVSANQQKEAIG